MCSYILLTHGLWDTSMFVHIIKIWFVGKQVFRTYYKDVVSEISTVFVHIFNMWFLGHQVCLCILLTRGLCDIKCVRVYF